MLGHGVEEVLRNLCETPVKWLLGLQRLAGMSAGRGHREKQQPRFQFHRLLC
jgi:hypothetical protein